MDGDNTSTTSNQIAGDVLGNALLAGVIHGDVHLHQGVQQQVNEHHEPPESWHTLPALPREVRSLLRAQLTMAEEPPYRLRGARQPSLDTVHVQQDLGTSTDESQPEHARPVPIVHEDDQWIGMPPTARVVRLAVRPPARTIRQALDGDDHLIVTGGPGQGKSTMLQRLVAETAQRWMRSDSSEPPLFEIVVPLKVTARNLAARARDGLPFAQLLADCVGVEYAAMMLCDQVGADVLARRVVGCRWLLLVDALDEVADPAEREHLVKVLAMITSDVDESPYRIVLTTRPIEGSGLAPLHRIGANRYELLPFDDKAVQRFAEHWFAEVGENCAYRFLQQVRDAHLDELARVPLLATIAAIIFEQRGDRPLPDNRYELYDRYLAQLAATHVVMEGPFEAHRVKLLEHLGRTRLDTDTSLVVAACEWATKHMSADQLTFGWETRLVSFLAAVGPMIIRGDDDLAFMHHSFADHLAASARARELPPHFEPDHTAFARLVHDARPEDAGEHSRAVLVHYTRLLPAEADHLMRWLHTGEAEQHLLAARLLAQHLPASADVIDVFLGTVRGWAITTHYLSTEILGQASRATHHPRLATWLVGLMRDVCMPWRSRLEAATALAIRLRDANHGGEALQLLRSVVDEQTVFVDHRLAAAEALAQSSTDERETAERGLRAVLTSRSANGAQCRAAAVVLAKFGPAAREDAVTALSALLENQYTPTEDFLEAATGLIEIGVEFYGRSADAFRTVLRDPVLDPSSRRGAALGLACLGSDQLDEAARYLNVLFDDLRYHSSSRTTFAAALAELGPLYKFAARKLLLRLLVEPAVDPFDKVWCIRELSQLGPQFRSDTLPLLRDVLRDTSTSANNLMWVAELFAELGPDFCDESAEIARRVLEDHLLGVDEEVRALDLLIGLGEPYRSPAVARLRRYLSGIGTDPRMRCEAANTLIRVGPELHAEIVEALLKVAHGNNRPELIARAWRSLLGLGVEYRDKALRELSCLMQEGGVAINIAWGVARVLSSGGGDPTQVVGTAMGAVLGDAKRAVRDRVQAARGMLQLGAKFHQSAVDGVLEILSERIAGLNYANVVRPFVSVGPGHRMRLADGLHSIVQDPDALVLEVWNAISALNELGFGQSAEVVVSLREIVHDDFLEPQESLLAAVLWARLVPEQVADSTARVLAAVHEVQPARWRRALLDLVRLGADVVVPLRAILQSSNYRVVRESVASVLVDLTGEGVEELRDQAADDCLGDESRSRVMARLVELDNSASAKIVDHHREVFRDESAPIAIRCAAGYRLVRLDQSEMKTVSSALRHLAASSEITPSEREACIERLDFLIPARLDDVVNLAVGAARNPGAEKSARRGILRVLPPDVRLEVERGLLTDHTISIEHRLPRPGLWGENPLAAEIETEVRDVLTAPEFSRREKVVAASALASSSARLVQEALGYLEHLSNEPGVADSARLQIAKLGVEHRNRIRQTAYDTASDVTKPVRERFRCAVMLRKLSLHRRPQMTDLWREVAADCLHPVLWRVRALIELSRVDGLSALRTMRDDERAHPVARWKIAKHLVAAAVDDRAAGVQVLGAIATDLRLPAGMRWRAAEDLSELGIRGHEEASQALWVIANDDANPVTARANAAAVLGKISPARRRDARKILVLLSTVGKPMLRKQVLRSLGTIEPDVAARELRAMALDCDLGPVVRLRCSNAMVELRRDLREEAALVARAIAYDESVSRQVRVGAARTLAHCSALFREEARELVRSLATRPCGA
ncbi:NACHT domain-containing protein [Lentzea sp. NEAU-D7]|uniref:NACHT domain-containing protein n=1 Tax=Lentzea sp. NEAU-D7 TaxID=2994667 RepID=UPI00224B54A7|nr:NACHT domain-containing protein [Lentzea sp. NEAU-D7]MCX2950164.1 NACHT domain-containing protein [Lentzea sp. NEAU-D7]